MNIFEVIQRISYSIRNDHRYRYYDSLFKNLKLSREKMITLQNELINKLVAHAYHHTAYYRRVMDTLNLSPDDIRNKDDLKKLPVLTKSMIRENISEIKSDDHYSHNLEKVTSGGSTGNQAVIYKSPYYTQMSRAVVLRNNLLASWKPGDKSVWIWGAPYEHQQVKDSFISKLGILINRRLLFNAYNYSFDDFPIWVDRISSFGAKVLYGYASIILEFAKYLIAENINLDTVKTVVSTSEALREREVMENAFKCNVYNQYGCREIFAIGIEARKNVMVIAEDAVVLNIHDNGEFIITALHSYGFPLINYKLGDRGEIEETEAEDDQLPFSRMNLVIGRITDNFLTKDGHIVASTALATYISTFALKILEHQIIQQDFTKFIVKYIPETSCDNAYYEKKMTKIFREYFGANTTVEFREVQTIPIEASGKKLMFKRTFNL